MVDLAGIKALLVEDEGPVALLIEDMLLELGCEIAASAADLGTAVRLAGNAQIDIALLDLNLNGLSALPVVEILRGRNVPFVFSTGYGSSGIPDEFRSCPTLAKPFVLADLEAKLALALKLDRGRR
jgi:CheY-like chemotaxis protein